MPSQTKEQIEQLLSSGERRISSAFRSVVSSAREADDITTSIVRPLTNAVSETFERSLTATVRFLEDNDITPDVPQIRINTLSTNNLNSQRLTRNLTNELQVMKFRNNRYIGLTQRQFETAESLRIGIETNNRPLVRRIWRSNLRDRRFDSSIQSFLDGNELSQQTTDNIVNSYTRRQINYRAMVIGRTESLTATNYARDETYAQAIQEGADITEVWRTVNDNNVRDSHRSLNGQSRGENGFFITGFGNQARYPGDSSLPSLDRINCRCYISYEVN